MISRSGGTRPQSLGGVLGRDRVDEKAAAPLEAGDPCELGNDLEMPVEGLELALAEGRRVQHEVERRLTEHPVHAAEELAEDPGHATQLLLGGILESRPLAAGEDPRLEP